MKTLFRNEDVEHFFGLNNCYYPIVWSVWNTQNINSETKRWPEVDLSNNLSFCDSAM